VFCEIFPGEKMKTIQIKKDFASDYISRVAGERLREIILKESSIKTPLTLNFKDLKIASTSFFDEAFAKLTDEGWDWKDLLKRVHLKNIYKKDLELLSYMCTQRKMKGVGEKA